MAFVAPAEHDEVVCSLATVLLADAGVKVDTAMIEKVGRANPPRKRLGHQGHQQHGGALLAHAVRQVPWREGHCWASAEA